jgi:hypothetical protein
LALTHYEGAWIESWPRIVSYIDIIRTGTYSRYLEFCTLPFSCIYIITSVLYLKYRHLSLTFSLIHVSITLFAMCSVCLVFQTTFFYHYMIIIRYVLKLLHVFYVI